jgi:hypothetical protein
LERRTGCRIFDRQGAGYGAAAAEEAVMLKGMVWVGAVLSEGTIWELDEPTRLALLEDQFAGFLGMESRGTE